MGNLVTLTTDGERPIQVTIGADEYRMTVAEASKLSLELDAAIAAVAFFSGRPSTPRRLTKQELEDVRTHLAMVSTEAASPAERRLIDCIEILLRAASGEP